MYVAVRLSLAISNWWHESCPIYVIRSLQVNAHLSWSDLTSKLMADCLKIGFLGKTLRWHSISVCVQQQFPSFSWNAVRCNCKVIEMIYKWRILCTKYLQSYRLERVFFHLHFRLTSTIMHAHFCRWNLFSLFFVVNEILIEIDCSIVYLWFS